MSELVVGESDLRYYPGYTHAELDLIREAHLPGLVAEPGFSIDFLGVKVANEIVWAEAAKALAGQLIPPPIPADYHAEAIEYIGVLKAVNSAKSKWTVIELGAGFGTWAIESAVAARNRGIKDFAIYMVEGDPRHAANAVRHFSNNGFDPDKHHIINAAVGAENGMARWPKHHGDASTDGWNSRPTFSGEGDYLARPITEYMDVKVIALRDLLEKEPIWDLIHLDIQGHETDVIRSSIDMIDQKVRWIVVGTHSRKIDGDIMQMMYEHKWICENEKPARIKYNQHFPVLEGMTVVDGGQVWRNPKF